MPWIGIRDAGAYHGGLIHDTVQKITQLGLENSSARLLPKDTICLSRTASVGYVVKMGRDMATSQDFVTWSSTEALDPDYLLKALLAEGEDIRRFGEGSTHTTIYFPEVKAFHVALPPVVEQRRIVARIDSLTGKSRRARDHLDHIPRLVEKYKKAVLAAAFRGDLTSRDRTAWTSTTLADVCDTGRPITYGVIKLGNEVFDGVPCLRTSNVRWLSIDLKGIKSISKTLSDEYHRTVLSGGEVLVNVRGTLGGVAVVPQSMSGWNVSREVAVAPVDASVVLPEFLAYWIAADASQQWLTRVEKGVAYTGINIEDLRKLPIAYPALDQQQEIVRRIETAFVWIDRLASEATSARKLVDRLDQAVLAKAFRGELVPQDPSDEPASVLLERIRAERGASPKARRGRKGQAT